MRVAQSPLCSREPRSRGRAYLQAVALVLVTGGLVGCAAGAGGASGGGSSNRITAEELEASGASNAYDAVQRLRPRWLQSRGSRSTVQQTEIIVALNGMYFGDVDSLRQFSAGDIMNLSWMDSAEAGAFVRGVGPGVNVEGAIIVELRGR